MLGARTPAAKSWVRLALRRSRRTFLGAGWWPGGIMLSHWMGLGSSPVEFVEPLGGFGELGEELGGDFGADFVAAASDGRADGGEQVGGVALELHLHLADGFHDYAGQSASPASVDGGDGALFRVHEENRDAVGGLDAKEEAGTVGHGGIALAGFGRCGVEKMDDVGMDLPQGD